MKLPITILYDTKFHPHQIWRTWKHTSRNCDQSARHWVRIDEVELDKNPERAEYGKAPAVWHLSSKCLKDWLFRGHLKLISLDDSNRKLSLRQKTWLTYRRVDFVRILLVVVQENSMSAGWHLVSTHNVVLDSRTNKIIYTLFDSGLTTNSTCVVNGI